MAKKNVSAKIGNDNELFKLVRMVLILVILFLLFYGLTYFLTNKDKKKDDAEKTATSIQYSKIEVGTMLKQKRDSYYVLLAKSSNKNSYDLYEAYANAYYSEEDKTKMYVIDLDSAFNKTFINEESNLDVDNVNDFKVSQVSLLKIEKGEVTDSYEGDDEVMAKLKDLTK